MPDLPETLRDEAELDDLLSRPSPALVEYAAGLEGDVLVLGAGGKIGPTLVRMARRALAEAGAPGEVVAVARRPLPALAAEGVCTVECDLLDPDAVARLPRAPDVVFMAGRKFGSTGDEPATWAANVLVPYHVARTFTDARVAVFSTGCVYPLMPAASGGATEETPPDPVGEYAMSCLGRERVFDYASAAWGDRVVHLRLNYAVELRYGVLVDVARRVLARQAVDLATAHVNVIWQGDACDWALRSLGLAASPPAVLNLTGPETLSVREIAETFGRLLDVPVRFTGSDTGRAYLSDASRAVERFGPPRVSVDRILRWTADWLRRGGRTLGKPTHFEVQDGRF
ncbi:MAG: NAD(P)-dependent oxidoreductase [Phycisphaerae bacterium]